MDRLDKANAVVERLAAEFGYNYIDVNEGLTMENGQTFPEMSIDGIHMYSDAYEIIFKNIEKYL